jgi:hypothetical protein
VVDQIHCELLMPFEEMGNETQGFGRHRDVWTYGKIFIQQHKNGGCSEVAAVLAERT